MISAKANPATKKKAEIYTIGYSERMIEKDGFKVIVDANGDILTDMQLLAKLRTLRQTIAQENGVVARILYDSVLVLLATDRPLSREEFIDIKGITISNYMRIGERFIAEIKNMSNLITESDALHASLFCMNKMLQIIHCRRTNRIRIYFIVIFE